MCCMRRGSVASTVLPLSCPLLSVRWRVAGGQDKPSAHAPHAGDDDAGCQPGAAGDAAELRARLKKVRGALNDLESTSERKDLETEMPTTMDELNVDVQRLKAEMERDPHRFWREARGKGAGDEDHGDEGDEGHPGEDSDEDHVHEDDEGEDSDEYHVHEGDEGQEGEDSVEDHVQEGDAGH